jgi:hypothetical protein
MKTLIASVAAAICMLAVPDVSPAQTWSAGSSGAIYYDGGNVGIGTTTPAKLLDVNGLSIFRGAPVIQADGSSNAPEQLAIQGNTNTAQQLLIGYNTQLDFGSIQAVKQGVALEPLILNASGGNVGIGTTSPQHLLHVAGTIGAEQVIVSSTGADYVFDPKYKLAPLSEVASYVEENHHLPGIPSADEMSKQGVSLGDMQTKLLAKIEELTLHMIELKQDNVSLQQQVQELRKQISHEDKP